MVNVCRVSDPMWRQRGDIPNWSLLPCIWDHCGVVSVTGGGLFEGQNKGTIRGAAPSASQVEVQELFVTSLHYDICYGNSI